MFLFQWVVPKIYTQLSAEIINKLEKIIKLDLKYKISRS